MTAIADQHGRTVVITGATSGLGEAAAIELAAAGARVVLAVRAPERGARVRADILARTPTAQIDVYEADLASLDSIAAFADRLGADDVPVDTLVNNAGLMAVPQRRETVDGFELQMGTNFLGAFALTMRLMPTLLASPHARVVMLSSAMARMGRIDPDDLDGARRRYSAFGAYGASKLADLVMALRLARVSDERGWSLSSIPVHPGYTETNLQTAGASVGSTVRRSATGWTQRFMPTQDIAHGVQAVLFGAASPEAQNGVYYGPTGRMNMIGPVGVNIPPRRALDPTFADRVWAGAERLTGTRLPD